MGRIFAFFIAPILLLAGCTTDEHHRDGDAGNSEITFEIGFEATTRVATDTDFKSTWEDGDEIGIFAVAGSDYYINNARITYKNGKWEADTPMYWPKDTELDFYAYHSYDVAANAPLSIDFNVSADQSAGQGELLAAINKTGYSKGQTVPLVFSHALAMVQLTLDNSAGTLDPAIPTTVVFKEVAMSATLDLKAGRATASGLLADITMRRMEQPGDANYNTSFTYRALVPAQTGWHGVSMFEVENGELYFVSPVRALYITLYAGEAGEFTQQVPSI